MSNKSFGKPKLSFDMDEEDEDGGFESFQVKKSKESRKFKKMRQAPGIENIISVDSKPVEKTVSEELGGSYTAENLAQLRKSQLFVAHEEIKEQSNIETTEYEPMELSGEAAEEFIEMNERIAAKETTNLGEYVGFDKTDDLEAIQNARLMNKTILKGNNNDRVYTSNIITKQTEKKVLFDMTQENDSDWENEIISRGVIHKTPLNDENKEITEKITTGIQTKHHNHHNSSNNTSSTMKTAHNGSIKGEISIEELMKSVELAVEKLTHNTETSTRQIAQIENQLQHNEKEEVELRSKVEVGVRRLNVIQDIKYYFASLVGMLREKSANITELSTLVLAGAAERLESLQQRRIDDQEDVLLRLKEASLMISLGNYTPTGVLSTNNNNNSKEQTKEVDEYGRMKANPVDSKHSLSALQKREDRRLKDRLALTEVLPTITEQDKGLILANRLCEVSTERKRILTSSSDTGTSSSGSLYMVLENICSLYNTKGEELQFAKKIETYQLATLAVLDDVQTELVSMSNIISRLEQFREAYPVEYENAFVGESMAELLQPLILLDLLGIYITLHRSSSNSTTTTSNGKISFKTRDWYQPISQFILVKQGKETKDDDVTKSAPKSSMMSMAAQINNLFEEEDLDDADSSSLLSKIADTVLFPWLRDYLLIQLDPYSDVQCSVLIHLLNELSEFCSSSVHKLLHSTVKTHIEKLFLEQIANISLPLLKLNQPRSVCTEEENSTIHSSIQYAHAYIVQQLIRLQILLENFSLFRFNKLIRIDSAVHCGWQVLTEDALSSLLKLCKVGSIEDKLIVLDIVNTVLSLISGCTIKRTATASSSSCSNTVHDGQLMAWRIPPSQYRPLRAAAEGANTALLSQQADSSCSEGKLDIDHITVFADLVTVLSSFSV